MIAQMEKGEEDVIDEFRRILKDNKIRRIMKDDENKKKQADERKLEKGIKEGNQEALEEGVKRGRIHITPLSKYVIPIGFDGYPSRSYNFPVNNVLSSFYFKPSTLMYMVPVPAGTIPAVRTFESGYSMLVRLTNYPINLLYDKIGIGWTSLIMAVKITLVDFPFSYTMMTFNHEYSGHAVRALESGGFIDRIEIGAPPPYGRGGGATYMTLSKSIDQTLMTMTAGSEANTALAHEMALGWVANGSIYPFDILLYLNARFDQLFYITISSGTPSGLRLDTGGDYDNYLLLINNKFGRVFPHNYRLTYADIRKWSFAVLADPFLYMSAGAFFYNMITGKRFMETLMIPLGTDAGMIPSTRVFYTPHGPECSVDLFFRLPRKSVLLAYARGGSLKLRGTGGAGVRLYSIEVNDYLDVGAGLDLFNQPGIMNYASTLYLENASMNLYPLVDYFAIYPQLFLLDIIYGNTARHTKRKMGWALYGDMTVKLKEVVRFNLRLGYKTAGYVPGMALDQDVFWHMGLGFYF
ncbi:MAG: hypothetical protein JW838_03735 [Spirochaetes bacterium]|nr:hypothetical protein [Spirochaetota bacterium]